MAPQVGLESTSKRNYNDMEDTAGTVAQCKAVEVELTAQRNF